MVVGVADFFLSLPATLSITINPTKMAPTIAIVVVERMRLRRFSAASRCSRSGPPRSPSGGLACRRWARAQNVSGESFGPASGPPVALTAVLVVQKFGGTSVADPERIRAVADHVARTRRAGDDVIVVVSAMGKSTDDLMRLAYDVADSPTAASSTCC